MKPSKLSCALLSLITSPSGFCKESIGTPPPLALNQLLLIIHVFLFYSVFYSVFLGTLNNCKCFILLMQWDFVIIYVNLMWCDVMWRGCDVDVTWMWCDGRQATGLDALASRVKCPAQFVSHLHEIFIYIWVVYSFCLFCCLFIIVTWWYIWCIVSQVASKRKYRHVW